MKRLSEILMICAFSLFLIVSMTVTLSNRHEVYSYFENRLYEAMPEVSAENIIDGDFFDQLESFFCDHAAGRQLLLKAKTYTDVNILQRPVVNDVVITDDALLPYNNYEKTDAAAIEQQAESMAEQHGKLSDLVSAYGGTYIYTAVPCQYVCYEDEYPFYLNSRETFTNAEITSLTNAMKSHGVEMIDMLPVFESSDDFSGEDLYYSSTVDNHYSLRGAYVTYREIIERINSITDYNLEVPGVENGEITFSDVEEPYLGSRQRKLMGMVDSGEHLQTASFSKDIPFSRTDGGQQQEASVYSDAAFENGYVTYSLYMGGDIPETLIETNRPDLPSVLIYGDSFTNAVESLAYYSFNEMRSIDMRYYSEMFVAEYVERYKPDIVVCIRDYESLLATDGNGSLFSVENIQ